MKLCIIQCYPYLPHARSRHFAWHLLWIWTTKGKNIVKLSAISQTRQFQPFSTDLPSIFWKIASLLGKIKNTVSLRFRSLSFPSKKSSSERTRPYWQWIVCTMKKGNDRYLWSARAKTFTPYAARTIIFQRENLNFLIVCFTQCTLFFSIPLISIADLFAVRYLWDLCNEDNRPIRLTQGCTQFKPFGNKTFCLRNFHII